MSLNGNYQDPRFLSVLMSGAASATYNGFRRVDAGQIVVPANAGTYNPWR